MSILHAVHFAPHRYHTHTIVSIGSGRGPGFPPLLLRESAAETPAVECRSTPFVLVCCLFGPETRSASFVRFPTFMYRVFAFVYSAGLVGRARPSLLGLLPLPLRVLGLAMQRPASVKRLLRRGRRVGGRACGAPHQGVESCLCRRTAKNRLPGEECVSRTSV